MTLDHAVALSLLENLRRVNLTERLKNDPHLLEQATPLLEQARVVRERAERAAIQVIPWNDPNFPTSLATLTDLPPVLWYQGRLSSQSRPQLRSLVHVLPRPSRSKRHRGWQLMWPPPE